MRRYKSEPLDADLFLTFLRSCNHLTRLEIYYTDLNTYFYSELVQVPSLATLHSFILFEIPDLFRNQFSFDSLLKPFRFLQYFCTNMISKPEVITFCHLMQPAVSFRFEFPVQADGESVEWDLYEVRRTIHNIYMLTVGRGFKEHDENFRFVDRRTLNSLSALQFLLIQPPSN